jgi:hypothetical protein
MLFKDPPPKEECPICFIPMPSKFISYVSLPDATISSVPIYDFAIAHEEFAQMDTGAYYACCGKKYLWRVCLLFLCIWNHWNDGKKCPFCNSGQGNADDENNDNAEE